MLVKWNIAIWYMTQWNNQEGSNRYISFSDNGITLGYITIYLQPWDTSVIKHGWEYHEFLFLWRGTSDDLTLTKSVGFIIKDMGQLLMSISIRAQSSVIGRNHVFMGTEAAQENVGITSDW